MKELKQRDNAQATTNAQTRASNKRTRWIAGIATVAVVALGAAVYFATQRPQLEGPIDGDKRCRESEAYPCLLNPDDTIKYEVDDQGKEILDEHGKPVCVKNPFYSKKDCHRGDLKCDDKAEVEDMEGNILPEEEVTGIYLDGTAIPSPLENQDSPDCIMAVVQEEPCAELAEEIKLLTRGLISVEYERWRTPEEILALHDPENEDFSMDDNDARIDVHYEETCDMALPLCTPQTTVKCKCPNHSSCLCQNGTWDEKWGEECDPSNEKGKNACGRGQRCASNCTCVGRGRRPAPEPLSVAEPEPVKTTTICPKPLSTQKGREIRQAIVEEWSEFEKWRKRVTDYGSSTVTGKVTLNVKGNGTVTSLKSVTIECKKTKEEEPCSQNSAPGPNFNSVFDSVAKDKNIGNQGPNCIWPIPRTLTAPKTD